MTAAEPVVIDASAFMRSHTGSAEAIEVLRGAWESRSEILAPDLILAEVSNSLRKYIARGVFELGEARDVLTDLQQSVSTWPLALLFPAAFETALARGLTPYDAAYVELAEGLDAKLVTADKKLAGATPNSVFVR